MKAPLGYVAIHKDKLSEASFKHSQKQLKSASIAQEALIDKRMARWWPFRPKTRILAAIELDKEFCGTWWHTQYAVNRIIEANNQLQAACQMSEGYVYLDIAVVHKLFGE